MILNASIYNSKIPIKQIYLLYGSDLGQLLDSIKQIKAYFPKTKKYYFLNFKQFSQFYNINQQELFNRDLFCLNEVNKIVEIYLQETIFNKANLIELEALLNKIFLYKNVCLILFMEKPAKNFERSKLFELINKQGIIIISKKLGVNEFKLWLTSELQLLNLTLTPEAFNKFIEIYQHNLLQAKQIIKKLSLYYNINNKISNNTVNQNHTNFNSVINLNPAIKLNLTDLMQHIEEHDLTNTLFDLQNSLTTNNLLKVVNILNNLKQQAIAPILVLWSIIQVIKKIMQKYLNNNNNNINNNAYVNNNINNIKYSTLLAKTTEIDLAIKCVDHRLSKLDQEQYLWELILDLCMLLNTYMLPLKPEG